MWLDRSMPDLLTDEEVALLTPEEAHIYQDMLELEWAKREPLNLAQTMFPETRRWPQLELLNEHLVALSEYRLTAAGPVPLQNVRWWYVQEGDAEGVRLPALDPHHIPEAVDAFGAYDVVTGDAIVFRLAISMRPRAGKSRLVTEVFPFWLMLQDPDVDAAVGTYSDTFAWDWGGAARDYALEFAKTHKWFPTPRGGPRAGREIFYNDGHRGKIRYTGVGGGITGKSIQVLIGDDFIKNDVEAQSETTRNASHRFYDRTWKTRKTRDLSPGARFPIPFEILMATRWHEDDVTGHACFDPDTRQQRDDWCVLNIPALSKGPGDPLGRPEGQAHPNAAGETRADMERLRADDPRGFSALYQGEPSPESGGLIPTTFGTYWTKQVPAEGGQPASTHFLWRGPNPEGDDLPPVIYSVDHRELVRFTGADMAATQSTTSDFTVLFACGYSREHDKLFILDRYKQKITTDRYVEELIPFLEDNDAGLVLVENVTYGQKFQQDIMRLRRKGHKKLSVGEMPKMADKVARALASGLPSMTRARSVLVPKDAPWREDMIAEVGLFPFGTNDDQVDALAFAAQYVSDLPPFKKKPEPKVPTLEDEIDAHAERAARRKSRRGRDLWSAIGTR